MNKNTDKEKGMKMEMLDADREYFLVYANSVQTFTSTLKHVKINSFVDNS